METHQKAGASPTTWNPPFFIGVDIGGTNTKIGLVDDQGHALAHVSIPTDAPSGPDQGVRRMQAAIEGILCDTNVDRSRVLAAGLGSPGTMDVPNGLLLEPPNLPGWWHYPLRDKLAQACGLPVAFANDANAAAYGEFWAGRGREYSSMVMLTLGTGVGGGIIIGDLSVDGAHSHGSECGHIIIDWREDALVCACGQPGHLEAYASATAVIKRTQSALAKGAVTTIHERLKQGAKLTPELLKEEASRGDTFSLRMIEETAQFLGVGVVSLMHTIDPAAVVIGGGMTFGGANDPLGRQFLEWVRQEVRKRAFPLLAKNVPVDYALLGSDAGFIGAAGVARLMCQKSP